MGGKTLDQSPFTSIESVRVQHVVVLEDELHLV